jgi:hypothetical protein
MLKLFNVFLFLISSIISVNAQFYFSKTYFTGDSINQRGKGINVLDNNIYILTGRRCQNFTVDCGDVFSIDAEEGNLNWSKNYDWVDFNWRPLLLKEDTIITVGYNNDAIATKWYLNKTSIQGDNISNDTFDFKQTHLKNINIGIDKIKDGFIMYGFGDDLDSNEILSIVLLDNEMKLDTMYDIQFDPEFNWMIDVREDFSGDLVFIATHGVEGNNLDERRIIRMNREGEETWSWTTGIQQTDSQPNAFEIHPEGSYFFYQYDDQADMTEVRRNVYLYNVDTTGTVRWIHEFIPEEDSDIDITEMVIANNGDILLVGDRWTWDESINNFRPHRGYIARMSYEGELLWERQIFDRHESGMEKESFLFDIAEMEDGSIIATGSQERIEGESWKDLWLVKLSPDGCLNTSDCSETLDISVPVIEIENQLIDFYISPNPSNGIFNFEFKNPFAITNDLKLLIYNSQGHILTKKNLISSAEIDLSAEPNGLYYYSILNNNQVLDSGKLLKHD